MNTKITERYIPSGYTKYSPEIGEYPDTLFECYVDMGKLCAIFYRGKSLRQTFHIRFRNVEDMKKRINATISDLMSDADRKEENRKKRQQPHALKVGDILYSSWGYEQTNINFYQVTRIVGARTVEIREIHGESTAETSFMTAHKKAIKDAFKEHEKPVVCRVNGENNSIKLSSFEYLHLDDGRMHRYSWYG